MRKALLVGLGATAFVGCAGLVGLGDPPNVREPSSSDAAPGDAQQSDIWAVPDPDGARDALEAAVADEPVDRDAPDAGDAPDVSMETGDSEAAAPVDASEAAAPVDAEAGSDADGGWDAGADADANVEGPDGDGCPPDGPTTISWSNGFETDAERLEWYPAPYPDNGTVGFDVDAGLAHTGASEGWVNTTQKGVWSAINTVQPTGATKLCTLSGWILAGSVDVSVFFAAWDPLLIGVPGANPQGQTEIVPGNDTDYVKYTVTFTPPCSGNVVIDVGIWGLATQQWVRVDDFSMTCN